MRSWFRLRRASQTAPAELGATSEASAPKPAGPSVDEDYQRRAREEQERFAEDLNIHDLPPIFHYWSHKYLLPMMQEFGFSNPDELFAKVALERAAATATGGTVRILSLGAGNCDTEVRVGTLLQAAGLQEWELTCMDLVPEMLERGRELAGQAGLADHFRFVAADINTWQEGGSGYDVVMANQFLHHVVDLETLFTKIREFLAPDGRFVTSDMIGRNGHQRWPEARMVLERFWAELPEHYRYNVQLKRLETEFMDWDCSQEGFEGIRSQDVLPLLTEFFGFEQFMAFANVIGPFVDRGFGWHFDPESEWDRDFIDRVHAEDERLLDSGEITPTQLIAVMTADRSITPKVWRGRTPARSIRSV